MDMYPCNLHMCSCRMHVCDTEFFFMQDLGWATELVAGPGTGFKTECMFSVGISLTEEGLPNWRRVLQVCAFRSDFLRFRSRCAPELLAYTTSF